MNQFAQSAKFSDQLSTMPDQMLPRLAQQYKNDAITLSLILSEKNRRERMRGAASAQQAGQPQPKVNDAVVASMAAPMPEDVGIGQLPTPNMERMAGGGLVAFADGGDVGREELPALPGREDMSFIRSANKQKMDGKDLESLMLGLGFGKKAIAGANLSRMSEGERDNLARSLMAAYNTRFGDLDVNAAVVRPVDAPSGVYMGTLGASYPMGQGRIMGGVNALRTPDQGTQTQGYTLGYAGKVGPGFLEAQMMQPKDFPQGRSGRVQYRVPFADGGEVDRYQSKGSVDGVDPGNMLDAARARVQAAQQTLYTYGLRQRQQDPAGFQTAQQELAAAQAELQAAERQISGGPVGAMARPMANPAAVAPAAQPGPTPQELAQFDAATNLYMTERAARQAQERGSAPPAGPRPPAVPGTPGASPAQASVDALAQYKKDIEGFKPAAAKTPQQIMEEKQKLVPEEYRGKAYEGLEKSLRGEADAAAKEKQQAFWMSVMQAGLSTAAGSSPYALKNIAEGMGVGLSSYKDSLAQFKKAEKERQKMLADIEQSRRAEARGDADAAIAARDRADDRMDRFNGYAMQGIASLRGAEMQERGQSARAAAQLQATLSDPARLAYAGALRQTMTKDNPKGDPVKAYQIVNEAKREPMSRDAALKTWSSDLMIQQRFPNFEDYFRMAQGTAPMGGASQISPSDAALVNKYLSPPR